MRKIWSRKAVRSLLCLLLLCVLLALPGKARAVSTVTARLKPDMTILIDGSERTFYNAGGQEVHPILYNGTTYLPVRAIGELMGKNVDWNQSTLTVTLSGTRTTPAAAGTPDNTAAPQDITAELRDDFTIIIDGTARVFTDAGGSQVYPLLYQGSTYLPVRAIGELMGKTVGWDGTTQTVTLSGTLVTDADSFSGNTVPTAPTAPTTPTKPTAPAPSGTGALSMEEAKAAALAHAGLTAEQVTFTKQESDREDGQKIYEIEFFTASGAKYEYEIRAADGMIIDFDSNLGYTTPAGPVDTVISLESAKEIALGKVSGATAGHISKCKLDHDDGRLCYEVEIIYNNMEYEFKIEAATGAVLSAGCEAVHHHH